MDSTTFKVLTLDDTGTLGVPDTAPYSVWWLALHAFANVGTPEIARSLDEIHYIAFVADGFIRYVQQLLRDSALTYETDQGDVTAVVMLPNDLTRQRFLKEQSDGGFKARPATDAEFQPYVNKSGGELLQILFQRIFKSEDDAKRAFAEMVSTATPPGAVTLPVETKELLYCYALRELDLLLQASVMPPWNEGAVRHFGNASIAAAIGGGAMSYGIAYSSTREFAEESGRSGGRKRASKLEPVKQRVLELWTSGTWTTATKCASAIKGEILELARKNNVTLIENNVERSIKDWIREKARTRIP